ncbi:hypothetical protein [Actinacidiphila glaucinigra]|uniref:WXG100 family type VII secretion target n=1 Tax=Actinacidiphila glaucinigra TaxID=235986 RepID=A0A239LW44_9ACTN|nr:hypothetical protein [Actinacidiphila glaucinigra]SNT34595.1 hypothetical protein SAMN05216252_121135 [Actinacidiphila glaucinigra]
MDVPESLAELRRQYDTARRALDAHHRATKTAVLEWSEQQRAESVALQAKWQEVAAEFRAAIEESGLEAKHGSFELGRAIRKAAYGDDYAGE